MNLLRGSLLTLGVLLMTHTVFSQDKKDTLKQEGKKDTLKLSVADAQKYAIEYNRSVKAAKIDIEIAKKKVWETTAIGLPQFTATADYQHLFKVPLFSLPTVGFSNDKITGVDNVPGFTQSQPFQPGSDAYMYMYTAPGQPLSPKDNITFNFTVSQLIFSGEYLVGLQAAKVYKELSEKSYIKSELTTKESVATSYYMALVINENIKVLKESMIAIDKTYNDISKMNEQGFNENTDVDQMKINKSNLQTLINSLESQKEIVLKLMKFQLGVDFEQSVLLTDSIQGIITAGNFQYLSSEFNVNNSVDYELMKTQEGLMLLSLRREKTTFLPTIAAFYRHQELLKEPIINFQPKDVLGASLNFPIFTSGQRLSRVAQARLELNKTRLNKANVEQSLIMEFDKARTDYQTAFNNYATNKESMELSQKIYQRTTIKYSVGVGSSFDLTQSQNQYLSAESNYYNSLLTLLNAKAKIDRILNKYEQPN